MLSLIKLLLKEQETISKVGNRETVNDSQWVKFEFKSRIC